MSLDLAKIKQLPLKETEYIKEAVKKTQIVLHHTAGNSSGVNVVNAWNNDSRGRIATCVVISGSGAKNSSDGEIVQAFSSKFWAYHLGVKQEVFSARGIAWQNLDKISIGIEVCNWGQLELKEGKYYNYVGGIVPESEVTILNEPYKGHKYFHAYTDSQIDAVRDLLIYWKEIYGIDLTYSHADMWGVSDKALKGQNGLFTHNSYRKDKIDIYPCPRMILMLKGL